MIIAKQDQDNLRNSLQSLYDLLNKAYWYPSTIEAKDAINGSAQAVFQIITVLNQAALDSDSDQYKALKITVTAVNKKLTSVPAQIDNWIHDVGIATQVASVIDQALGYAKTVFGA